MALLEKWQKGTTKELNEDAMQDFKRFENEDMTLGEFILNIIDNKYKFNSSDKMYWVKNFCEAATEEDRLLVNLEERIKKLW